MGTRGNPALLRAIHGGPAEAPRPESAGGVALATVVSKDGNRWRVRSGGRQRSVEVDPSVDPLLVEEALASGSRVLLELTRGGAKLVGVVQTARALRVDRNGVVEAEVERFSVRARTEAVLKTFNAFLQLKGGEVELRGVRTLVRAREMAKVLARIISLN